MVATWSMLTPSRRWLDGAGGDGERGIVVGSMLWRPTRWPARPDIARNVRQSSGAASDKDPLDAAYHRLAFDPIHDVGEVVEVPDFDLDHHFREVLGASDHAHIVDVAVGFADHLGDLGQGAGLVEGGHQNLGREPLRALGIDVPGDIDPALVLVLLELWRMDLEDADAVAFRQHADDAIAGHRAALLELHRHVIAQSADRQHLRLPRLGAAAARPAKLQVEHLGQVEPALFALAALAPVPLARRRRGRQLGIGNDGANDIAHRQLAAPDRGIDFLDRLLRQAHQGLLQLVVGIVVAGTLERGHQQMPAELGILPPQGIASGAANGGFGLAGDGDLLPGGRRRLPFRHQHFHLIAIPELRGQRQVPAVDDGTGTGIADVGVHRVGKVDRRGATRQRNQPPFGREAEHLILEQLELGVFEKLLRVVALEQGIDQPAQPHIGVLARLAAVAAAMLGAGNTVLVEGVGGHAILGDVVHVGGADLQLDALVPRTDDGGVDRLVVVLLRRRDVVLEAVRHGAPGRVNDAQRAVAGVDAVDHDAKAVDVGQLLERDAAVLHLAPDRERLLFAALDLGLETGAGQARLQCGADLLDQALVAGPELNQLAHHR